MPGIGIVIVTYNSAAEIGLCLDAAHASGAEIIVVDNASQDGTCAEVVRRGVRLIANEQNRGFAAAVNQGVRALDNPYILLLNPDAVLRGDPEPLRQRCADPATAAAGGRLVDAQGRDQHGFVVRRLPTPAALACEALLINRLWPRNPVNWHYRCLDFDLGISAEVEQPAGAFLMFRRAVWEEVGGFDESFFPLWFEDVDFCNRVRHKGYGIWYIATVAAEHAGGHSLPRVSVEMRQLYWYRSLLRYAAKHFHSWEVRLVALAVASGSVLRMLAGLASSRTLEPLVVYGKVIGLAARSFLLGWPDATRAGSARN